ncbi:hypothetical protein [Actinomadura litoris]|uniref:hypothetical protein n=1 Tax=Actinomadura litoris TaxID=2678616 RepID=UPI001FA6F9B5|nr:hypothetical protein [Actinomadura litoris]
MPRSPADRARRDALHDFPTDTPDESERLSLRLSPEAAHLEALAKAIDVIPGFRHKLISPIGGEPFLRVVNSDVAQLAEDVRCGKSVDYVFAWSWGEVIGPASEPQRAAEAITRVLSPKR